MYQTLRLPTGKSWNPASLLALQPEAIWPDATLFVKVGDLASLIGNSLPTPDDLPVVTPVGIDYITGQIQRTRRGYTGAIRRLGDNTEELNIGDVLVPALGEGPAILLASAHEGLAFASSFHALRPREPWAGIWLWACLSARSGVQARQTTVINVVSSLGKLSAAALFGMRVPSPGNRGNLREPLDQLAAATAVVDRADTASSWWRISVLPPDGNWHPRALMRDPDLIERGVPLGELADVQLGRRPQQKYDAPRPGLLPVLQGKSIDRHGVSFWAAPSSALDVQPGDVLMTEIGSRGRAIHPQTTDSRSRDSPPLGGHGLPVSHSTQAGTPTGILQGTVEPCRTAGTTSVEPLACQLSPATLTVLYEMLQDRQHSDIMRGRANLLGEDPSVLSELQHLYKQWWSILSLSDSQPSEWTETVSPVHGKLATWFLSPLRGSSLNFSDELRRRTQELFRAAMPADQQQSAINVQPIVVGWSLGSVSGDYDQFLPVVFAEEPTDSSVRLAYMGLAEHLIKLGEEAAPWPEVRVTSVIWRCAGIAEGLVPKENLVATLQYLTAQVKPLIPEGTFRNLSRHWDEFTRIRNGLTHVAGRTGEYSFSDLEGKITDHDDLRLCLSGITYFVAENIRSALADPDHDNHRTPMLDSVRSELGWLT